MVTADRKTEVLIIGAGIAGSALAMHLADLGAGDRLTVVDLDLEGHWSSSELNAGGVRGTWTTPLNVRISKSSIDYFSQNAAEVGYRACGYLWMLPPEKMDAALRAREMQMVEGWPVEVWDLQRLQAHAPFIDKTDRIGGVIYGPRDGLVNPNLLKLHYREKARAKGVRFLDRHFLRSATLQADGSMQLQFEVLPAGISTDEKRVLLSSGHDPQNPLVTMHAQKTVNCAGAWAPQIAKTLGYHCPSRPLKRQISIFDCRGVDLSPYGMMIDPSGVYFHPEGGNGLCGLADSDQAYGIDFHYDGEVFFQEKIWSNLYELSTKFEQLKHVTGWAGLYEVAPDHNAIVGEVSNGVISNRRRHFEMHSFSGHGVMQTYATGLDLAHKILDDRFQFLDLAPLSAERFQDGSSLGAAHETWII